MNPALLAQTACMWEATARKIGNVHPGAAFADTEFVHFLVSAAAMGQSFCACAEALVGARVLEATKATRATVGVNTNLGMVLLLAPLVADSPPGDWRSAIGSTLRQLSVRDTALVYQAIRLARPGGLGDAPEQNVHSEPTVTLIEAMRLAADRDLIARQYVNNYADVFEFGVPAFLAGFERFGSVEAAIVDSQLQWLAEYPDSLIARKIGPLAAAEVQARAAEVQRLGGIATPQGRRAGVALDTHLRSDGNRLNPGTTADLITACLYVALREHKVTASAPFRWHIPDWL